MAITAMGALLVYSATRGPATELGSSRYIVPHSAGVLCGCGRRPWSVRCADQHRTNPEPRECRLHQHARLAPRHLCRRRYQRHPSLVPARRLHVPAVGTRQARAIVTPQPCSPETVSGFSAWRLVCSWPGCRSVSSCCSLTSARCRVHRRHCRDDHDEQHLDAAHLAPRACCDHGDHDDLHLRRARGLPEGPIDLFVLDDDAVAELGADAVRVAYNAEQSQIAIGNGGLTGTGLFQGTQTSRTCARTADRLHLLGGGGGARLSWRCDPARVVRRGRRADLAGRCPGL